ncbi:MAG: DnaB-like helicase C-terminal domain-containing protein [bacterium]
MTSSDIDKKQKQFIYLLLNDKYLLSEWVDSNLFIEKFDKKYQTLLTFIHTCYVEKEALLTKNNFDNYNNRLVVPKDRATQTTIYGDCSIAMVDKDDFNTLASEINDYFFNTQSKNYLIECTKKFNDKDKNNKDNIIKLKEQLDNLVLDADLNKEISYRDIRTFSDDFFTNIEKIRSGEKEQEPRILCGIKEIDETMVTGFARGSLTVFCADVGGFKSAMMLNIGLNIWENTDKNVLFVPIEMPKERLYNRAISRQSGVPGEKIYNPKELTDDEVKRLKEANDKWKENKNKFYICEMPEETTVESIKRVIERYIITFNPHVVIIDYIDNLEPDQNYREDRRDLQIRSMVVKLRKMGQQKDFAVVSGAQLGKESLKKLRKTSDKSNKSLNSEDIRGAHTLAMYADNIYAQVPNMAQPDQLLDIYVVKARDGKKIFPNGSIKASLEVVPEVGYIRSPEDVSIPEKDEELMSDILEQEESSLHDNNQVDNKKDNNNDDDIDFNDNDDDGSIDDVIDKL